MIKESIKIVDKDNQQGQDINFWKSKTPSEKLEAVQLGIEPNRIDLLSSIASVDLMWLMKTELKGVMKIRMPISFLLMI